MFATVLEPKIQTEYLMTFSGISKETGVYKEVNITLKDSTFSSAKDRAKIVLSSYLDNILFVSGKALINHISINNI